MTSFPVIHPAYVGNNHQPYYTQPACYAVMAAITLFSRADFGVKNFPGKLERRIQPYLSPSLCERTITSMGRLTQPEKEQFALNNKKPQQCNGNSKSHSFNLMHCNTKKFRVSKWMSTDASINDDLELKKNVVKRVNEPKKIHKYKASKKARQLAIKKERMLSSKVLWN